MTGREINPEDAVRIRRVLNVLAGLSWFNNLTPEHQRMSAVEAARIANVGGRDPIWQDFAVQWETIAIAEQTAAKAGQYMEGFKKPPRTR